MTCSDRVRVASPAESVAYPPTVVWRPVQLPMTACATMNGSFGPNSTGRAELKIGAPVRATCALPQRLHSSGTFPFIRSVILRGRLEHALLFGAHINRRRLQRRVAEKR